MGNKLNILDHIATNLNSDYKLAEDLIDGEKFIVKFDKENSTAESSELAIDSELGLVKNLKHPGIHQAIGKIYHDDKAALVYEYLDASPLSNSIGQAYDLRVFFQLAFQKLEALNYLHKNSIVHLAICPENFWLRSNDQKVYLGGFSKANSFVDPIVDSQLKVGKFNPSYISPEQTGRLSDKIDHRADIYALGLVFYLLLTGKHAFPETTLSKLIHYHLTVEPDPPHKITNTIPEVLSKIITKMIAKNPADRYQIIDAIIADFTICNNQWSENNSIQNFQLASNDVCLDIDLTEVLIGREVEIKELERLINSKGSDSQIVFIEGEVGIGKTSLLNILQKELQLNNYSIEFFTQQKAFQTQAYDAIFQIINNAILPSETDSFSVQAELKNELNGLISKEDYWISDFIPNLKYYIDDVNQLDSSDSQSETSIKILIYKLLSLLAGKGKGLIVILDDFHHSDLQSRELIKEFVFLKPIPGLFLFISYQASNISADHFFNDNSYKEIDKVYIKKINLKSISKEEYKKIFFKFFDETSGELHELSEYLYRITNAKVQFTKDLLKQAQGDRLLHFNLSEKRWDVQLDKIKTIQIPELTEAYYSKIENQLSAEGFNTLKIASVYGMSFNMQRLSAEQDIELQVLQHHLEEAAELGLINQTKNKNFSEWSFVHNLIIQSLSKELDEFESSRYHAKSAIGKLSRLTEDSSARNVFSIANHLLFVQDPLKEELSVSTMLSSLLSAASLAKQSYAFDASYKYFSKAQNLAQKDEDNALTAEQIMDGGICAYLKGEFTEAEELLKTAKELFQDPYDKARVLQSMLVMNNLKGELDKIFEIGVEALSYLGVKVGTKLSQLSVLKQLVRINFLQRGKKEMDYFNLPIMLDKEAFLAQEILLKILTQSYSTGPEVMAQVVLKIHELTLKYGNSSISYAGYGGYGAIQSVGFGKIEKGTDFAILGVEIAKKFEDSAYKFRAIGSEGATTTHRARSIEKNLKNIRVSLEKAIQYGDYTSYGPNSFLLTDQLFYLNIPLSEIRSELQSFIDFAKIKNYHDMEAFHIGRYSLLNTLENIIPEDRDEQNKYIDRIDKSLFKYIASSHYCHELFCAILTGSYNELDIIINKCESLKSNNAVTILEVWYPILKTIALIFSWIYNGRKLTEKQIRSIKKDLKFIKKLEGIIPENYKDYVSLLSACISLIKEEYFEAIKILKDTNDYRRSNFILNRAFKKELIGVCYLRLENQKEAFEALAESYDLFDQWGAKSKLIHLLDEYGQSLHSELLNRNAEVNDLSIGNYLDVNSLIKASHILAEDINLESLVRNLVKVIVENTGASKGMLFLLEEDQLRLKEIYISNGDRYLNPVDYENDFPKTIINRVQENQQIFFLANAYKEYNISDPYIITNELKSILCCPLIRLGKLIGISYLENNLLTGAFTKDRIQLIETISSQAALSIDNAAQYSKIIQLNKAYERFVPKEFIRFLNKKEIFEISLGDQVEKEMSVMFSDIRDFTTISEKMSPQENFNFINNYLREMEPIVWKNGGFIDKFIGDSIMALFPNKPENAINCAIQMHQRLQELNETSNFKIDVGYGINTGNLMLGIIGGRNRMEGTVISDTVNLAARVESLTKVYKKPILITEDTKKKLTHASDYEIEAVDTVIAKGKTRPVIIYELKLKSI